MPGIWTIKNGARVMTVGKRSYLRAWWAWRLKRPVWSSLYRRHVEDAKNPVQLGVAQAMYEVALQDWRDKRPVRVDWWQAEGSRWR